MGAEKDPGRRLGDWKLIYYYTKPEEKRYELFDLSKDPTEANHLTTTHPDKLRRMVKAMSAALEDADAQYPVAKDDPETILKPIIP